MNTSFLTKTLATLLLGLFMVGCEKNSPFEAQESATPVGETLGGTPTSNTAGRTIEEITLVSGTNELVMPETSSENVAIILIGLGSDGLIQGFEIDKQVSGNANLHHLQKNPLPTTEENPNPNVTEDFHAELRLFENQISEEAEIPETLQTRFLVTAPESRQFNVIQGFSNNNVSKVTGSLIYEGTHFNVYMDTRDIPSTNLEELLPIFENFAEVVPYEQKLFGKESDINGDGKFEIFMTREVNALGERYGGLITGYFFATDLFAKSSYPTSNEREVIFTIVPDPTGILGPTLPNDLTFKNILPNVLPHEYQHMISFNRHYFKSQTSPEVAWLNEGLSHLAEDIYSINGDDYMETTSLENPSRVARYLRAIDRTCFACGSNLEMRGGSYLFLRYLYEQAEKGSLTGLANGADLIDKLLGTSEHDIANINQALSGDATDFEAFYEVLGEFALSLYLSDTSETVESHHRFEGIQLRALQNDTRGTLLNGPAVFTAPSLPITGTTTGYSISVIHLPKSLLDTASNTLSLKIPATGHVKAFVVSE